MTSLERRREGRYQRRKAARECKKQQRYARYDNFERITSYRSLYYANRVSMRNVSWKTSVQRYQMNLLRNFEETRTRLMNGENVSRGFVEFDTIERGKMRHIRSVHYSERVVQRSLCDNALVPMLSRNLIYDNGACLKGKGVDRSLDRLTAHLQQFYRANGNSNVGWGVLFDFTGYFDGILHSECFNTYSKAFHEQRILELLEDFVMPFGYPPAETNWRRVKPIQGAYTGMGLGLGSQVSQITAVAYPNALDHFIKEVLRVRWYQRYMDDGYMLFRTKQEATAAIICVASFCRPYGIKLNKRKTRIVPIHKGIKFLKAVQKLTETGGVERSMCRESVTRQRRRLKKFATKVHTGEMTVMDAHNSYGSAKGYALRRGGEGVVEKLDELFRDLFGIEPPQCKLKKQRKSKNGGKQYGNHYQENFPR